jgi:hypothetical protein
MNEWIEWMSKSTEPHWGGEEWALLSWGVVCRYVLHLALQCELGTGLKTIEKFWYFPYCGKRILKECNCKLTW